MIDVLLLVAMVIGGLWMAVFALRLAWAVLERVGVALMDGWDASRSASFQRRWQDAEFRRKWAEKERHADLRHS